MWFSPNTTRHLRSYGTSVPTSMVLNHHGIPPRLHTFSRKILLAVPGLNNRCFSSLTFRPIHVHDIMYSLCLKRVRTMPERKKRARPYYAVLISNLTARLTKLINSMEPT